MNKKLNIIIVLQVIFIILFVLINILPALRGRGLVTKAIGDPDCDGARAAYGILTQLQATEPRPADPAPLYSTIRFLRNYIVQNC